MMTNFPLLFTPEPDRLLSKISKHLDDDMLRDIAHADYGHLADKHFAILLRMRDEGLVPPSRYDPKEVLELIRWSEPDLPGHKPGGSGERGHWMRVFCCAFLLRMAGQSDPGFFYSFNETMSGLLASLEALDKNHWDEAGSLLTWFGLRTTKTPYNDEDAFLGVAILYCSLRTGTSADEPIVDICKWISEREGAVGSQSGLDDSWLHRTTPHDQRKFTWEALGRRMGQVDVRSRSPEAREWLALIINSLAEEA